MATITGTITGVTLVRAKNSRKSYLLTVDFGAYTGATDDASIADVGATIATKTRNGKTNTLRSAVCIGSGRDANSQEVFTGALTVSTDALTGNLAVAAGTEITSTSGTTRGVELCVVVDES